MNHEVTQEIKDLEKSLGYLINSEMTIDQKIKALSDSYWSSHNAGYCDYMAGKLMGGVSDTQTERWELDCKYIYEVSRLLDLLKQFYDIK